MICTLHEPYFGGNEITNIFDTKVTVRDTCMQCEAYTPNAYKHKYVITWIIAHKPSSLSSKGWKDDSKTNLDLGNEMRNEV